MDNIAMPVTLVVKAPNQQIEDQTVQCELNWTIKRLKGHLSEVYPSKPRLEDQKLIYSGQLLVDTVQLKDVLRTYDGQENHTVHLVCSPPRDMLKKTASSSKNVNNSNSGNVSTSSSSNSFATARSSNSNNSVTSTGSDTYLPANDGRPVSGDPHEVWASAAAASVYPNIAPFSGSSAAHQLAWMQQAYSQYINSYIQYLSSNQSGDMNNAARLFYQTYNGYMAPGASPYNYQQLPYNGPPPQQQQQQQQQPNVAAANNQQQAQDNDEDEGRMHRDWLDWFYIITRVLVLFSIVYFYSSPIRFLMVSTLGMIMYLYQVGFFRMQGLDGRNEAGGNNNRIIANGDDDAERENNNDQPNPAGATNAAPATNESGDANSDASNGSEQDGDALPPAPAEVERPSFLSLTWTILCSFLLSLIPEQPNVI